MSISNVSRDTVLTCREFITLSCQDITIYASLFSYRKLGSSSRGFLTCDLARTLVLSVNLSEEFGFSKIQLVDRGFLHWFGFSRRLQIIEF